MSEPIVTIVGKRLPLSSGLMASGADWQVGHSTRPRLSAGAPQAWAQSTGVVAMPMRKNADLNRRGSPFERQKPWNNNNKYNTIFPKQFFFFITESAIVFENYRENCLKICISFVQWNTITIINACFCWPHCGTDYHIPPQYRRLDNGLALLCWSTDNKTTFH